MPPLPHYLPIARHPPGEPIPIPTASRLLSWLPSSRRAPAPELLAGPIRGELLGAEHLAERARSIAAAQRLAPARRRRAPAPLLARLDETRRILARAHERIAREAAEGNDVGPAGEWFLDNYHVVQEHIREVRESLPRGYYRELPELGEGRLAGYPRVYELAITLISHTEGRIDLGMVEHFAAAFQEVATLSIGELWATPAMLRLALLENVRRTALRTVHRLDETAAADEWAGRILQASERGPAQLQATLDDFVDGRPALSPIFVTRLLNRLRLVHGALPSLVALEQWIADEGLSAEDAAARSTQRLALTQVMMANSIMSLRAIAFMDWREFVEQQSAMEAILRRDPSGFYPQMTFATRDHYRHVVERIAKRTRRAQEEVAERAVALAAGAPAAGYAADERVAHVGYYLIGSGRADLERATGYRPGAREAVHRWVLRHPDLVLGGGIAGCLAGALAAVLWLAGAEPDPVWFAVLLIAFPPAFDIAIGFMTQLITSFLPPRTLPKLDLQDGGIPEQYRTAVVVPTLFESVAAVHEALENLEVQFLANREAHLHFAVLSDFADADAESVPGDEEVLAAAADGIRRLNERYTDGTEDAFYLFHRPRRWNPKQGVWMGWERKRGKLGEFNRFLRGGAEGAFSTIVGDPRPLQRVRYVITLDSDTTLPPDAAPALIGALAHPLNRAVYDARSGRVVRGYGILQPRVGVSLPSAHRSRFAAIQSGHPGVDPYTTAVSDVYQDLFGEGSFTGKGIYDVDAFETATNGRFPDNALLSHDLIEGGYARAGLATDVTVYDDYPARYLSFTRRKHRWIRGDWQLLPWLPRSNELSLLSRWKLFDNLRRSTVEISQLVFLLAGWLLLPGPPLRWTLLGLGAIAAPWLISLLLAALRPPFDKSLGAYYAAVGRDAISSAQQLAITIVFLPHQAGISTDAIVRTLWRLFVSRRNLLEWQTASRTERAAATTAGGVWRAMWGASLLGGALLVVVPLAAGAGDGPPWSLALAVVPLAVLWLLSPALAHALDAAPVGPDLRLRPAQAEQARRYAELHWAYFERFVTAETGWLVPDNYQDDPAPLVAMRTSPTNIGLQLLATVSARDLGLISLDEMVHRIEQAFRTLERLRRYRGHFYNWYDLTDLRVLEPAYISTVDSGNLAGHLLAVRQACLELAGTAGAELAPRLQVLAERSEAYVEEMEFGFLFDPARKLFAIGYNRSAHALDASYYDLLASEARLASFIAIAKNEVPVEHWFRLGRALTRTGGATALASWSGSMFEYLMPSLVMETLPYTLLHQTANGAVRRQISYGSERGVPWGVSESAYNVRDHQGVYQYHAFGVPDLALKRGLDRDLVIAPYAAALALQVKPDRALANLAVLEAKGALGPLGFRDALDYTRPPPGRRYAVVQNYMAHHVGMTLAALANGLLGNIWQRRFHRDPLVRSAELLLHERIPRRLVLQQARPSRVSTALPTDEHDRPAVREIETPDTPQPRVALLGHLPYTIMVSHAGGGYSRYESLAVSRWRSDGTTDATGQFCYVKDLDRDHVWSVAHQPTAAEADWYRAVLATDRITFHRGDGDVETRTEIAVVPEDAAEIRRVTVTNNGGDPRDVELTSYAEVVLAPPESERAHPAFANLFVETEWHEWCSAITASRRPRSATEPTLWCAHVVDSGEGRAGQVTCETDRARFLGRGRSARDPLALEHDGPLSMTTGAVLDPVLALRTRVHLEPGEAVSVTFTTLVAETRERLFELAGRYHDPHAGRRALDLAWTSTQIELRELGIAPADALVFQELAGNLLYSSLAQRAPQEVLERNRGSRERLWAIGVSGDWPIVVATIDSADGLTTLRSLLAAHRFWRRRGMTVDLVIVNSHPPGYLQELNDQIDEAIFASGDTAFVDRPGGIFVRRHDVIAPDDRLMLRATARLIVPCDGRSLDRIARLAATPAPVAAAIDTPAAAPSPGADGAAGGTTIAAVVKRVAKTASDVLAPLARAGGELRGGATPSSHAEPSLHLYNGLGGLTPDGDYQIRVEGDRVPPAPWTNVVANRVAGFIVTERGGGYTWAENSQSFRLTPWHNDPVTDPPSEVIYLRDEGSGELWSATPGPVRSGLPYTVVHGPGGSSFAHERDGIASLLSLGVAGEDPVKVSLLRLTNRGDRPRRITVTAYAEWTLGVLREHTQHQVMTRFDPGRAAMFARNSFDSTFAHLVAFCAMSGTVNAHTGDRREFLGRNGSTAAPSALAGEAAVPLSGAYGAGLDPCAALQQTIELAPGASHELVVILGAVAGQDEARRLVTTYRDVGAAAAAMRGFVAGWEERLSVVAVRTPDQAFDAMVNRWALYQALGCRMWARSALYQSSGAYGFRDQLQDVMAFVYAEPGVAREHILRSASRQFLEGDVQHWWHPPEGRGVRTRFSDDLVWLPFVVDHYVRTTGDGSVLDEYVPFLTMRLLEPDEHEVYDLPTVTDEHGSVYEHCLRALRKAATVGPQGLPLMGSGDWNDGMNRVGIGGRGESVWLAWFLVANLRAFAVHVERRGDAAVAEEFRAKADAYVAAVEANGWDGAWYRRAYYDDGTPLGSAANDECRIDAIAQSWSIISHAGDPDRQKQAMRSLEEHLVRDDARLLMLLTPAFDETPKDPGYIKGYVPGVRENGAQYTHAALWSALATAMSGNGERAFELYQMINPLTHASTPEGVAEYKVEPYVVAADVYTAEGHLGRGGWTWYTGSASWLYRVGLESILGFTKEGDTLRIDPRVPAAWPEFRIDYRHGGTVYAIVVQDPGRLQDGPVEVVLDGRVLPDGSIPLMDDSERHDVIVRPAGR